MDIESLGMWPNSVPQSCPAASDSLFIVSQKAMYLNRAMQSLSVQAPDQNCCDLPSSDVVFPDSLRLFLKPTWRQSQTSIFY